MQRRYKHAFSTIERLCFLRGPCRGVIKMTKKIILVEFREASLAGYELGAEELN
jgi:hypothetical protein